MKKIVFAGFLALVLIVAGCRGSATGSFAKQDMPTEASGTLENGIRVINLRAFQFDFDPNPIIVNQNEKVRLMATSTDVTHGIAIPDYGIYTSLPAGRQTIIEFIADKKGTFAFFCNVYCGSGHKAMTGSLIVQ